MGLRGANNTMSKKREIELSSESSSAEGEEVGLELACAQMCDVIEESLRALGWTMRPEYEEEPEEFECIVQGLVQDYFQNENDEYLPPTESEASEDISSSADGVADELEDMDISDCDSMEAVMAEMAEPELANEEGDAEEVYGPAVEEEAEEDPEHPEGCWCQECYEHPDDAEQ